MRKLLLLLSIIYLANQCFSQIHKQIGQTIYGENEDDATSGVALNRNGDIVVIGSPWSDKNGNKSGAVRVFELSNGSWVQKGQTIPGQTAGDRATNVCINQEGNIIAIGARYHNGGGFTNSGHVRIFEFINGSWEIKGNPINGQEKHNESGSYIDLNADGSRIVLGCPKFGASGNARVFEYKNGDWEQIGSDLIGPGDYDSMGNGISINSLGNIIAIGSSESDGPVSDCGDVKVYKEENGNWTILGDTIFGTQSYSQFGWQVDLNGNGDILAIGARWQGINGKGRNGMVKVFKFNNDKWELIGDSITGVRGDFFGANIQINEAGNLLAVGSPEARRNNKGAIGSVRLFKFENESWIEFPIEIIGEKERSYVGGDLSLSDDGSRLAVCHPFYDIPSNFECVGKVEIFDLVKLDTSSIQVCSNFESSEGHIYNNNKDFYLDTLNGNVDEIIMVKVNRTINNDISIIGETINSLTENADYQWVSCDNKSSEGLGENEQSFTPTTTGSYSVIISKDGCEDTSSCSFIDVSAQKIFFNQAGVFPNPTNGVLNIPPLNISAELQISDDLGRILLQEKITQGKTTITNLSSLSNGVYTLKLSSGSKNYSERIVLSK